MVEGNWRIPTTIVSISTANAGATPSCSKMISLRPAKRENTNSHVHSQMPAQQITFPSKGGVGQSAQGSTEISPAMKKYLYQYGGQQLTTGPQAKANADHFIAVHLLEMRYNRVYATVSQASMANPNNAGLKAEVQTGVHRTTLRGLLLEAYAFWQMGQIALIGAICAFAGAAAMLVLSGLGFWHLRRTDPAQELFPAKAAPAQPVLV